MPTNLTDVGERIVVSGGEEALLTTFRADGNHLEPTAVGSSSSTTTRMVLEPIALATQTSAFSGRALRRSAFWYSRTRTTRPSFFFWSAMT